MIDKNKLAYYLSQLELGEQTIIEYELLTPITETHEIVVSAVLHCCKHVDAKVVHIRLSIDFETGRVAQKGMHQVSVIPWDVVMLVNSLNRRLPIHHHRDFHPPNPLEYPLDPVDQGHHSCLPVPYGDSSFQ